MVDSYSSVLQGDCNIYPDMAAYHSIAVTLGQGGLLRELLKVIECMRQKPKKIKHMRNKNWDPVLEPDCVVYNAVREHLYLELFLQVMLDFLANHAIAFMFLVLWHKL